MASFGEDALDWGLEEEDMVILLIDDYTWISVPDDTSEAM